MWDLIVSVPDHCLSFYLPVLLTQEKLSQSANKEVCMHGNLDC